MTDLSPRLAQLGDALEAAAAADLSRAPVAARRRRRFVVAAVSVAVVVPGVAAAAGVFDSAEVAKSLPPGPWRLRGPSRRARSCETGPRTAAR